jgi:hypothetical protein
MNYKTAKTFSDLIDILKKGKEGKDKLYVRAWVGGRSWAAEPRMVEFTGSPRKEAPDFRRGRNCEQTVGIIQYATDGPLNPYPISRATPVAAQNP